MCHIKTFRLGAMIGLLLITAAALAENSKLRVHVYPPEAYIFVDGAPFGDGGRTIKIAPGSHKVAVYNYGFAPQVRDVTVEAGTITAVEFTLQRIASKVPGPYGRIQIEGASRAAILLNGKTPDYFVGHGDEFNHGGTFLPCCHQLLVVPVGTHQLTIVDVGGKERWSGVVKVGERERVIINANNGTQRTTRWDDPETGPYPRFSAGLASAGIVVAPVSGSLASNPGKINCGETAKLAWTTADTAERRITIVDRSLEQEQGELEVQPKQTTSYELRASGPGGSLSSTANVDVNTAVQSSLQATPAELRYRRIGDKVLEQGTANLSWTSANAQTVAIDKIGSVKANDSTSITAVPTQQADGVVNEVRTYTLTAKNECGGSDTQTASFRMVGSIEPIPEVPLASVFFPTGVPDQKHPHTGLVRSQQKLLDETAASFKKYLEYDPNAKLVVYGNTDERDSNSRNKPLSERRAERVKNYLVSVGIPDGNIDTIAQGKEHPLTASTVRLLHEQNPNKPPKPLGTFQDLVWAYNRRVDLTLQPKGTQSKQFYPATAPEAKMLFDAKWPERPQIIVLASQKESLPVQDQPKRQKK